MIYDLQKGSLLKRASAFLLDGILLVILVTGFLFVLSAIFGFNRHWDNYSARMDWYIEDFDIDYDTYPQTEEELNSLPEVDRERIERFEMTYNSDSELRGEKTAIAIMSLSFVSVAVFLSYMVLEFILPMIFKNGQTPGKKIFGLAVMRTNGVRIRGISLFARTFLGKYVVETMVPVLVVMMFILYVFGFTAASPGLLPLIVVILLLIAQISLVAATKTNSMIHDIVSDCVVVDLASQMIFDSEQARTEYIARKAAEDAAISPY